MREASGETYDAEILIRVSDLVELRDVTRQLRDLLHDMRVHEEHRVRVMFDTITRLESLEKAMPR